MSWMALVCVFLGGGLGSMGRYMVGVVAVKMGLGTYPWGTFAVNIIGAFLMGVLIQWFTTKTSFLPEAKLFLTTGVLGGFTTFSTYILDIVQIQERGELIIALLYAFSSLLLGVLALLTGMYSAKAF